MGRGGGAHVCRRVGGRCGLKAGWRVEGGQGGHTLFTDETVIPVVRVVCIPRNSTASVAYDSEVEFCRDMAVSYPRGERVEQETMGKAQLHTQELMAEAARVARVVPNVEGLVGGRHGEMKSEQSIPERAWNVAGLALELSSSSAEGGFK